MEAPRSPPVGRSWRPTSWSPSISRKAASTATRRSVRPACARWCTASRTRFAAPASKRGGYFASKKDARYLRSRAGLDARQPIRRVQLARMVQLRPVPRVWNRRLRRQLGLEREDRTLRRNGQRLCSPAVLCLLHPIRGRRSDGHLRPGPRTKRACSSTGRALARISATFAANKRNYLAAARPVA